MTPTFWCSINLLTLLFFMMLGAGYLMFFEAMKINELHVRYDDICKNQAESNNGRDCIVKFNVTETLSEPYVYYRLNQFYSNYRSFVKSKDQY